jgi:acetyltransferase-like isoleucine patch superfamily enzyme
MTRRLKDLARALYYLPGNTWNLPNLRLKRARVGAGFETTGRMYVRNRGTVTIGSDVRINSSGRSNPIGGGSRTYLQVLKGAALVIGDGTRISNIAITCGASIQIGRHVRIGAGCRIYDTDFHSLNPYVRAGLVGPDRDARTREIVIEDFAFIGAGCFILKGARIGRASIVGAGSVVTGTVPPEEIWGGNPARFIRSLTAAEKERPRPSQS